METGATIERAVAQEELAFKIEFPGDLDATEGKGAPVRILREERCERNRLKQQGFFESFDKDLFPKVAVPLPNRGTNHPEGESKADECGKGREVEFHKQMVAGCSFLSDGPQQSGKQMQQIYEKVKLSY